MAGSGDGKVSTSTSGAHGRDFDMASCSSSGGTANKSFSSRESKEFWNLLAESFSAGQHTEPGPCNKKTKRSSEKLKGEHCFVCQHMESECHLFFMFIKQYFKKFVDYVFCKCETKTLCNCDEVYQTAALKTLCIEHKKDFVLSVKGNFCSRSSPGGTKRETRKVSDVGIKDDLYAENEDESTEDEDFDDSIDGDDLNDFLRGIPESQSGLLSETMRSHIRSGLHEVSDVVCGKTEKVLDNVVEVGEFFSENYISEDIYQPFLLVVTRMIKNVTADERDFVPPCGYEYDFDDDDNELLRSHFLFDKEKKKYFCKMCLRFLTKHSDPQIKNTVRWAGRKTQGATSSKCFTHEKELDLVPESKFIENLCLTGHFFASYYMPDSLYHEFCSLLNVISKNVSLLKGKYVLPLGPFASSIKNFANAKQACYQSCKEEIQKKFKKTSSVTNELPKITLAVQESLAEESNLRIYIVASYVGVEGLPQEMMLSAARLRGEKLMCKSSRLKQKVSDIVNPKQIAVISSNRDSLKKLDFKKKVFKKKTEQDMLLDLKAVGFPEKLIYLQDISSLCENLLQSSSPCWVRDSMLECSKIYRSLNNPRIASPIQEYANMNESMHICFSPPECCDDISFMSKSLAEFWYLKVSCVLENVEIIVKSLPPFVQILEGFHTLEADSILESICNPAFIAKLIVLKYVLKQLFLIENAAKDVTFNSFDYIRVINHMKREFEADGFSVLENAQSLLDTGVYHFNLDSVDTTKQRNINLADIRSKCYPSTKEEVSADDFVTMFRDWISSVVDHVDDHIIIPQFFLLISSIFGNDDKDVSARVPYFRELFSLLPVNFAVCSKDCLGIQECACVARELERFFSHMHDLIKTSSSLYRDEKQNPVYKKVFAYYLSQDNVEKVQELNVVNVLRALEVIQLMKASNSSSQRVASVISKYFEMDKKPFKNSKYLELDIIDISTFLAMNSDLQSMNTRACFHKYSYTCEDSDEDEWEDVEEEEEEMLN